MKANQLIAGTVIAAGLIFGASAQAQGLGGLGGHVGGALGGGAGGGMAHFNGTADGFAHATRIQNQDASVGTATDTKGRVAAGDSKTGNAGSKPTVSSASTSTAAAATAQSASQPAASQRSAQVAGGASVSKGGIDADASAQGTANHGGFTASGGASTAAAAGR
jgi:hypothetical protein